MNRQIVQLFGLTLVLFAVLVGYTSKWAVFDAQALKDNVNNRRPLIEEQQVPRGLVRATDGTVVARSRPRGRGPDRTYVRDYPTGSLFGHAVGYSFIAQGRAGLERSRNAALAGEENEFGTVFSQLQNRDREGKDVTTTLDPGGQRAAFAALAGRKGAVVALEPRTGRVRVMASVPQYDPNDVPRRLAALNADRENSPLVNRATQARYPPGSTFKVVTAAAALDGGRYTPDSVLDGRSPRTISGVPLRNSGGESFGPMPLTDALTHSVNTIWAQVGESLGRATLARYMERFGFNQDPQLDYPDSEMVASGVRDARGRLLGGGDGFDVGRVAIGQGGAEGAILVTPLQMAQVAAAVANRGRLMRPRLTERIVARDGRADRIQPELQSRVISERAAAALTQMMGRVVEEGTGTAAALSGIRVAGKTGTAEVDNATANQAWFIGFAPLDDPKLAVAVTIERTQGQGGTDAAPVARQVLQTLLGGRGGR